MKCIRCKKDLGEPENKRFIYCRRCQVMVVNQNYKKTKEDDTNKK